MTNKTQPAPPTVWDRLAQLPEEKRAFFLNLAPNKAKITSKGNAGAVYEEIEIIAPESGLVWRPGAEWDAI